MAKSTKDEVIKIKNDYLNELGEKYVKVKAEFDKLKAEYDKLKDDIKEELAEGNYQTKNVYFEITMRSGSTTINKKEFKKLYPDVFDDNNIWNKSADTKVINTVKIVNS